LGIGASEPQNAQMSFCFAGFQTASPPQDAQLYLLRACFSGAVAGVWVAVGGFMIEQKPQGLQILRFAQDQPYIPNPFALSEAKGLIAKKEPTSSPESSL